LAVKQTIVMHDFSWHSPVHCAGRLNMLGWRTTHGDSGVRTCLNDSGVPSEKIIQVMEIGLFCCPRYCASLHLL